MSRLAIELIQKCIDTQDPHLDLGKCGLTDELVAEGTEFDKLLRQCTHLETLILSNEWEKNNESVQKRTYGNREKNIFTAFFPALKYIGRLNNLIYGGDISVRWEINNIQFLENLVSLKSLYLTNCKINEIKGLDKLTNLNFLNIKNNQITEIKGLDNLTNLNTLDISENQITEIIGLDNLINLNTLNISYNQITEIKRLDNLSRLNNLNLSDNLISEIRGLNNLTKLNSLNISDNRITEIRGLDKLTNLHSFNISHNQITEIKGLNELTNLYSLNIARNRITVIKGLDKLTNLHTLKIYATQIIEIKGLDELTNLHSLDISFNKITEMKGLGKLSNLQQLYIGNNSNNLVTKNLVEIFSLSNLKTLNLNESHFELLHPIAKLTKQRKIPVRYNNFGGEGDSIFLFGDPIFPPPAIISKGEEAIIAYFNSLQKGTLPLNEVKILLIGDGAAGKTSLVKQISGNDFDEKETQTHGIQIREKNFNIQNENIKTHFWDFGGQEIMHATHQFFLTKDCVYVLVLDGRRDERPEYWLKHIAVFGGSAPVLVVLNKCEDNRSYELEQQELKLKFPNIKGFFRVSCKTKEGINDFTNELKNQIYDLPFRKTPFSPDWTNIKEQLRGMEDPYITYSRYYEICEELLVIDKTQQQTLLDYLNSLGVILHFEELKQYDTQVLNPLWLTQAVYRIINSPIVAKQNGEFEEGQLFEILNDPHFKISDSNEESENNLFNMLLKWFANTKDPGRKKNKIIQYTKDSRLPFIAKAMQQFELSYCLNEHSYIIPDLLPVEPPGEINYKEYTLRFATEFYFLPPALLPRFMVQTHQHIKDTVKWRTGMMLNAEGVFDATAIVRINKEDKRLDIFLKGPQERELLAYIRSVLHGLYDSYEGLKELERIKEKFFLPDSDIEVELAEIEGLSKRNKENYSSGKIDKDYPISELKASIESPEYQLNKEEQPVKVFISYSRIKRKFRDELTTKLHLLTKNKDNFIELWIDENMEPGVDWKKEIDQSLENSDIVICLLSDEYFQSEYCMYEAEKALAEEKVIYPILINTCAWRDTFFAKINGYLTTPIEPVNKAKRPEHWQKVYAGVKQLITT